MATPRSTVVYASGADLESANPLVTVHPLARQIQRYALFLTLARLDSTLSPEPYLARAWTWSLDGRRLTMHLASGVRWHDGKPTTARDAAFTLDAARDPATGFPRATELAGIDSVRAADDTTLTIDFAVPPPAFPLILAELPVVPAHLLESVPRNQFRRHAFATAPVGNGPFRFVRRDAGRRWVFERDEDFPAVLGGPAGIERLVVAVVDEPTTKFAGLVSADLDVAGIAPAMAELVSRDPSLRVLSYPVAFSTVLVFNSSRPPFDDGRVRRAVDALIGRARIIEVALAGFGVPANSAVPDDHPWHYGASPRVSPGVADSLLEAAGWRLDAGGRRSREGVPFAFTLLTVGSGDNAIEQLLQADLRAHGITMELELSEFGAFLAAARATPKRFDALLTGVSGDLALSYLAAMFDSRLAGGALDFAGFHTAELDAVFEHIGRATTGEALTRAWHDVQVLLEREMPVSWIYHARGVQGISRRLAGVHMDLRGELATLSEWRISGAGPDRD